ncbi:hypothetical protein, partial [Thiomonas sp.]|uniref:hypothetical protein n=1 Tax=Thiomonas sp. TaxID=2047785 RepID=UPI002632B990
ELQGAQAKARLDAWPAWATPQIARSACARRVGAESGAGRTPDLARARSPRCDPAHAHHPDSAPTRPPPVFQQPASRDGLENRAHSFEYGLRLAPAGVDITRERELPAILG